MCEAVDGVGRDAERQGQLLPTDVGFVAQAACAPGGAEEAIRSTSPVPSAWAMMSSSSIVNADCAFSRRVRVVSGIPVAAESQTRDWRMRPSRASTSSATTREAGVVVVVAIQKPCHAGFHTATRFPLLTQDFQNR